ncbi:hypothetical protein [Mycolicibacterium wolinskyi]|uniref:hypothetical protein n=1 Tax=Mycolicibacterium wolinskyi TaxID=59750 RepID=UPI0039176ADD
MRRAFALFRDGRVEQRADRLAVSSFITWRAISSTDELSERDIQAIVDTLQYWKSCGEIEYRCRRIAEKLGVPA